VKGVIFNILEDAVTRAHGAATWDALLDAAGSDGAYSSLGNYPDSEIEALVGAAADALAITPEEVLRWFGTAAIPLLAERYAAFFDVQQGTVGFLESLNGMIHPEVRKLYPGAVCPHFGFGVEPDGTVRMIYRSPRRMCALAEGFIAGAAAHYGEEVALEHPTCMHRGDGACTFRVRTRRAALRCESQAA
jgi:predicted hydrocarbon binding protein